MSTVGRHISSTQVYGTQADYDRLNNMSCRTASSSSLLSKYADGMTQRTPSQTRLPDFPTSALERAARAQGAEDSTYGYRPGSIAVRYGSGTLPTSNIGTAAHTSYTALYNTLEASSGTSQRSSSTPRAAARGHSASSSRGVANSNPYSSTIPSSSSTGMVPQSNTTAYRSTGRTPTGSILDTLSHGSSLTAAGPSSLTSLAHRTLPAHTSRAAASSGHDYGDYASSDSMQGARMRRNNSSDLLSNASSNTYMANSMGSTGPLRPSSDAHRHGSPHMSASRPAPDRISNSGRSQLHLVTEPQPAVVAANNYTTHDRMNISGSSPYYITGNGSMYTSYNRQYDPGPASPTVASNYQLSSSAPSTYVPVPLPASSSYSSLPSTSGRPQLSGSCSYLSSYSSSYGSQQPGSPAAAVADYSSSHSSHSFEQQWTSAGDAYSYQPQPQPQPQPQQQQQQQQQGLALRTASTNLPCSASSTLFAAPSTLTACTNGLGSGTNLSRAGSGSNVPSASPSAPSSTTSITSSSVLAHASAVAGAGGISNGSSGCGLLQAALGMGPLSPGQGCVGLQNLGNTCFMNSILQSLNAVPELVAWFHREQHASWSSKAVVAPAYAELVRQMWAAPHGSVVSPGAFLRRIAKVDSRWGEGSQQDSQELLNSLLVALQSECNRVSGKPTYRQLDGKGSEDQQAAEAEAYARSWNDSFVDDIFGGQLQSTIQCQVCKKQSHCFDPFLELAIPIPPAKAGGSITLQECLSSFVDVEKLEGSESYKCEHCKKCQPHSKKLHIYRFPQVLVLMLKRFSSRSSTSIFSRFRSASKNNTAVTLEVDSLDLSPYCNPVGLQSQVAGCKGLVPTYQLIAVSHHSGSLEGGHYTAQARSAADGCWYNLNDSSVRRDSKPGGPSSTGYVLFYRLVNPPSAL